MTVTITIACELCCQQASKYQCPKCLVKYCSLSCYKLSSDGGLATPKRTIHQKCLAAVETQKEREFKELLKTLNNHCNKDDIEKVQRILVKDALENQQLISSSSSGNCYSDNDPDEDGPLSDVDSIASDEFKEISENMTLEERENFYRFCEKFAASASIMQPERNDELFEKVRSASKFNTSAASTLALNLKLKVWTPWWISVDSKSFGFVQDFHEDTKTAMSPIIHVKPMKSEKATNSRLVYHIIDLLLAYCCSCRVLNGEADGLGEMLDIFSYIISTSVDLSAMVPGKQHAPSPATAFIYENAHEVVQIFKNRLIASGYSQSSDAVLVFLEDTCQILLNVQYTRAALSDMIRAFGEAKTTLYLSRKCAFFLSLFNALKEGVVAGMIQEIQIEAESERSELLRDRDLEKSGKYSPPFSTKPLIQEL